MTLAQILESGTIQDPKDAQRIIKEVKRLRAENKQLKKDLREWESMTAADFGEMLAGM